MQRGCSPEPSSSTHPISLKNFEIFEKLSKDVRSKPPCTKEALSKFDEIEEAILFGSRAMGNHKAGSDVDLALKGT